VLHHQQRSSVVLFILFRWVAITACPIFNWKYRVASLFVDFMDGVRSRFFREDVARSAAECIHQPLFCFTVLSFVVLSVEVGQTCKLFGSRKASGSGFNWGCCSSLCCRVRYLVAFYVCMSWNPMVFHLVSGRE
jgi:hypothetical protein